MGLGMMLDGVLRRTPRTTGARISTGDSSWKRICILTTILGMSLAAVSARNLDKRGVEVTANCTGEFSWMDNSLGQSPCTVSAWLLSQCAEGTWNMPPLPNASFHYGTPGDGRIAANPCSCAWATYNTLQACAFCQGESFGPAMITWDGYDQNCTAAISSNNAPWPPKTTIPEDTAIPFWAEQNPAEWVDATFDPSFAQQQLASQNKPDLTQADRNKKSTPTGAIVGGVVGGVVGVALLGLLWFRFFWRRKNYRPLSFGSVRKPLRPRMHGRSVSDNSTQKYSEYTVSPSPGIPTSISSSIPPRTHFHQHNGSSHSIPGQQSMMSLSYASHSPDYGVVPPGAATPGMGVTMGVVPLNTPSISFANRPTVGSPPMGHGHAHTLSNHSAISSVPSTHERSISHSSDTPEGAISPFILPPVEQQDNGNHRSKMAQDAPQTTMPAAAATSTPSARKAERRNPPAYSPVSSPEEQMFNSQMTFSQASVDAHAAESQGLSGTTLQESREPTVVSASEEPEEEEHHGFPADRKI
ncbi:hypothetical protein SCHPADRAFT_618271 [Schizopora paradoxa]|uniref:Uncharacterized protein n=1 Tax=Schizopora paradoxa TaxID=27342 RepID=A0A0H2R8M8_9AGAM|nr:hypothetical protein SCHPADRAFT_618271 [Schizopora paradoxa]